MASTASPVLPVCRSPSISSRCPRPMGIIASMALMPVCSGTVTGARSRMAGAGRSMGRRSVVATGPRPSSGCPNGSITRPNSAAPTPTSITRPVRVTSSPACRCSQSPSSTTPTAVASTLNAIPSMPPAKVTSSSKPTPGRPVTVAIPVDTVATTPTSRQTGAGACPSRACRMASAAAASVPSPGSSSTVMAMQGRRRAPPPAGRCRDPTAHARDP